MTLTVIEPRVDHVRSITLTVWDVVNMVLNGVDSDRTRRDYERALLGEVTDHAKQNAWGFLPWAQQNGVQEFTKGTVTNYIKYLKDAGVTDSSINQRLSAIRKLALESADNGLIGENEAQAIKRAKGPKILGRKQGNWLTKSQAEQMINAPDTSTVKGLRDRAVLAVLIGCGLRREEMTTLTVAHLQQREGRWVILDLTGKHNRTRTIPMASWVKSIVDEWLEGAGINAGTIFPSIRRGGHIQDGEMSSQAIWNIVQEYSPVGKLAPHDLRRTFAKLAHKAGAPIEQIQKSLGHASVQTTEGYIGADLNLQQAPSDMIDLDL